VWNPNFRSKWQGRYSRVQKFFDRRILTGNEPFVPKKTGALIKTGILGTVFGSGLVQWLAFYASKVFYSTRSLGSATGPLRGPYWFFRWKAADGAAAIRETKREFGR
jgi:hypothetical protein